MSSLDSVVDAIRANIPTYSGFTTKQEMLNPYLVEDNPVQFLNNSWGLVISSGSEVGANDIMRDVELTTVRQIGVVLSRAVYDLHNSERRINEESKSLLLDAKTIRDNFLNSSKLGVMKGGEEIVYVGDSGINFLQTDKEKFIYTTIDFTFEIIEQLT